MQSVDLEFGSKAETLARIAASVPTAQVLSMKFFSYAQWQSDRPELLASLAAQFAPAPVIVRSSATDEDGPLESHAGEFLSVDEVDGGDEEALGRAVDAVFASYGEPVAHDQVLVQRRLDPVQWAGVLFTCVVDSLSPYYVMSYSRDTRSVTAGSAGEQHTYTRFKGCDREPPLPWMAELFTQARVLESAFGTEHLDIEFGVDEDGSLFIFQVRQIATAGKEPPVPQERIADYLDKLSRKLDKLALPHPDLAGDQTVFGVMPDWNPAEILGARPRALSLSLYRELITDRVWAVQRDSYGYRDMTSFPLLVNLLGLPYVDVRLSFNSFIPKELSPQLASKLADYYLDRLRNTPAFHDKVEFDILYTCSFPGIGQKLKVLLDHGFTEDELDRIKFSLLNLTNQMPARVEADLAQVRRLKPRHELIVQSEMSLVQKIYWLLEDCRRFGTLPFAGLARGGFVAMQFLHALVDKGVITEDERSRYMTGLNTISREIAHDTAAWRQGDLSREAFLERYGHLRPGTYDICSYRYDEAFDQYFADGEGGEETLPTPYRFSEEQRVAIGSLLQENGLRFDVTGFEGFIRSAIEGREYGKFVFTRSLSEAMRHIEMLGDRVGLTRDEMSYVNVRTISELHATLDHRDLHDVLLQDIENNRAAYRMTRALRLPPLIRDVEDVEHFVVDGGQPNFITMGRIEAKVVPERRLTDEDLAGAVIAIGSADPGYDWLFTRGIGGLITEFGGVNSHMAIRAAELDIPAVIGCGEANFRRWSAARRVDLDCAAQIVRVLS